MKNLKFCGRTNIQPFKTTLTFLLIQVLFLSVIITNGSIVRLTNTFDDFEFQYFIMTLGTFFPLIGYLILWVVTSYFFLTTAVKDPGVV
jgi:restriction endonuclease S subunit